MRLMRVRAWCAMVLFLLSVGLLYSQPGAANEPGEKKEKQELGPTAKTKEEVRRALRRQ